MTGTDRNGDTARNSARTREPATGRTSIIAEYTVELPAYHDLLAAFPGIQLTVEDMVACNPETVSVTAWVGGVDLERFERTVAECEELSAVRIIDETNRERLYQFRVPVERTTYWEWTERGGTLLDGVGTQEGVTYRMRFPDRAALVAFRERCIERGISFRLRGLHGGVGSPETNHGLTRCQHELLVAAAESGYFEVPRGVTLARLAERFDISDQAASERLRRGLDNLLSDGALDVTASGPTASIGN